MNILFITFFLSLAGIIIIIGRKLSLIKSGDVMVTTEQPHPFVPDFEKIKEITFKHTKKYGYVALFVIVKTYLQSSNFFKKKMGETKNYIKKLLVKKQKEGGEIEKQEVNKFLKMVSDYKHKIRHIKRRIHEEENMK